MLNKKARLYPITFAILLFFFLTCTQGDRNNPLDSGSPDYVQPITINLSIISDTTFIYDTVVLETQCTDPSILKSFIWTCDKSCNKNRDTTDTGVDTFSWSESGNKAISIRALDKYGRMSQPATCKIFVRRGQPTVTVADTMFCFINDSISIVAHAFDTNGVIKKYLWSINNNSFKEINDSTFKITCSNYVRKTVKVKVVDDDNLESIADSCIVIVHPLKPVIDTEPSNMTVVQNTRATFHLIASGDSVQYQWQKNGVNVSDGTGGNTKSYQTDSVRPADNGAVYRCIVSNSGGKDTTREAKLSVTLAPPVIISNPKDTIVAEGSRASFKVIVKGDSIQYQWQKTGSDLVGKTFDSLIIANTAFSDSGNYRCIISNSAGKDTSDAAILRVYPIYTVTYDGNGNTGGNAPSTQTKIQGEPLTFSGNTGNLVKNGYTFSGWNTAQDGSGTDYAAGSSYKADENLKLYAKWPPITVTDADGNVYSTVIIGSQIWTVENLRTTKYNDGTEIPCVADADAWKTISGYCFYNNTSSESEKKKWGALYTWGVVSTGKLAPSGWRVPSDSDWTILENYLITNEYNYDGTTSENKVAKSLAAKTDWSSSSMTGVIGNNLNTNNQTGFSALPGGYRVNYFGDFKEQGNECFWWSSTRWLDSYARYLVTNSSSLSSCCSNAGCGFSVRLVRDLN